MKLKLKANAGSQAVHTFNRNPSRALSQKAIMASGERQKWAQIVLFDTRDRQLEGLMPE